MKFLNNKKMEELIVRPDAETGTTTAEEIKKFEIKTRITSNPNGSSRLRIEIKNVIDGWKFRHPFIVLDSKELRTYLKSDEFKEYVYSIFGKYDPYDIHGESIDQLLGEKLNDFVWRGNEEPFKVIVSTKLIRDYSSVVRYNVVFSNNKDNSKCLLRRLDYKYGEDARAILDRVAYDLNGCKALKEKLATYDNWRSFTHDFMKTSIFDVIVGDCLAA